MEPQTFSFTVKLSHQTYVHLLAESKSREGTKGAVPSRTARQMIEERLSQLEKKKILMEKKKSVEPEPDASSVDDRTDHCTTLKKGE